MVPSRFPRLGKTTVPPTELQGINPWCPPAFLENNNNKQQQTTTTATATNNNDDKISNNNTVAVAGNSHQGDAGSLGQNNVHTTNEDKNDNNRTRNTSG
mmetsp:Transcript_38625/g.70102  ORF Transcript_38625/g.70102 Transcript_38625/m.70102 type:complete len:99 (+) Transcript_38625:85-381(+)